MPNRQYLRRARRTPRNFARMLLPQERDESADPSRAAEEVPPRSSDSTCETGAAPLAPKASPPAD